MAVNLRAHSQGGEEGGRSRAFTARYLVSSTLLTHCPVSRGLGSSENEFWTSGAAGYALGSLANIKSLTLSGRMGGPSCKLSSSWWSPGQESEEGTEASGEHKAGVRRQLPAHPDCPLEFCLFLEPPLSCSAPELSRNHFFFILCFGLYNSKECIFFADENTEAERGSLSEVVECVVFYTTPPILHVRFSVFLKSQSQLFGEMGTGLWPAMPKAPSTSSLLCMSLVASLGPLHTTAPLITPAVASALNLLLSEKPRGCLHSQVVCSQHLPSLASSVIRSMV